jgi:Uma2 family endonuclease
MTVREFLATDFGVEGRVELIDGIPTRWDGTPIWPEHASPAARGATPSAQASPHKRHGRIQGALCAHLYMTLRERNARTGQDCQPVTEAGVLTPLDPDHNYRVADIAVTCETFGAEDDPWVAAPVLIVEVLSPDQEKEQRSKLQALAALDSVREILFIDSRIIRAELHRRDADGHWPAGPTVLTADDRLALDSEELDLPLADLYRGIARA